MASKVLSSTIPVPEDSGLSRNGVSAVGQAGGARDLQTAPSPQSTARELTTVTSILVLARWPAASVAWGLYQLARGALTRPNVRGLLWRKVLGSGREGGFGLQPGWDRLAQLCVFADRETAQNWVASDPELAVWRTRAADLMWLELRAWQSRGLWSGHTLATSLEAPGVGPVASLTRASIRPSQVRAFWRHSPPAEQALAMSQGCRLAVGLGEAPLLRQATFSLWDSTAAMDAYARSGAHLEAIRHAYRDHYFTESMFVRFAVTARGGRWGDCIED